MSAPLQPTLVLDEPTHTGWCRIEFYGNEEGAHDLIHAGRTQLGTMKTIYGVNERRAANGGEGGGFYHRTRTLPDGATIQTITNDGLDTIRITAPGYTTKPTPVDDDADGRAPYLWVALRRVSGGGICEDEDPETGFFPTPHLYVWEPVNPDAPEDRRSQILSGRHLGESYSEAEYPLGDLQFVWADLPNGDTVRINYTNNGMYHMPKGAVFDPKDPEGTTNGDEYWDQAILLDPRRSNAVLIGSDVTLPDGTYHPQKPALMLEKRDTRSFLDDIAHANYIGPGYQIGCVFYHDVCEAPSPSEWQLEVRVGRAPLQLVKTFHFSIGHYTSRQSDIYPFGIWDTGGGGDGYFSGSNPHADGWWPTTLACDPKWSTLGESDSSDDWPRGFEPGGSASDWRGVWCGTDKNAQVFRKSVASAASALHCSDITTTVYMGVQGYGWAPDGHTPSLSGGDNFPNPCTGAPPPAQSITGEWTGSGGHYTWDGIVSSRPHSHNGDATTPLGTPSEDDALIGFVDTKTEGPHTGRDASGGGCERDIGSVEQQFIDGLSLRFHAWWDESGFHTAPGLASDALNS